MTAGARYSSFLDRVGSKARDLAPTALASFVILGLLWLLAWLLFPLFPESVQRIATLVGQGEWDAARDAFAALLASTGLGLIVAFLVAEVVQVLVAPLPGQLLGLAAGFLFGFWAGLGLALLGEGLGILLALLLARAVGAHVVRRLVPQPVQDKFDRWIGRGGVWGFFLLSLLPLFPDDAICFLAGLTRLNLGALLAACLLGRLPYLALLTFLGASAGWGAGPAYSALGLGFVVAVVVWLYSDEIEGWLRRRLGRAPSDKREEARPTEAGPTPEG